MNKNIINQLLVNGQSSTFEKIWLKSTKYFYKSFLTNPKQVINKALINAAPLIKIKQLKQKKKRSKLKEFPYIISTNKRFSATLKFFLNRTKLKVDYKFYKVIIDEFIAAAKNSGNGISKKKSLYEYAFLKKKYSYYRWF